MDDTSLYLYRRSYERFPLGTSAELSTDQASGIRSIVADISSRGAGIVTTVPFETGEIVGIILKSCFLFTSALQKRARVVWCKKVDQNLWQTGLDFGIQGLIDCP